MNVDMVLNKNALWLEHICEHYPERVGEEQWQTHDLEPFDSTSLLLFTCIIYYKLCCFVSYTKFVPCQSLWVALY